ncbi:hypothetical protein C8Q70DRAFT_1054117 [Cubamyces menziesii]|nr:hypothetical protein C8Q70DRAFT_1054117 [Cubamyces menziesii]
MDAFTVADNARAPTTPKRVLAAIHNLPRRMRSGPLRTQQPRARGKENALPGQEDNAVPPRRRRRPAPLLPKSSTHIFGLGLTTPRDLDTPSPPPLSSSARFHTQRDTSANPLDADAGANADADAAEKWAPKNGQMIVKVWVPTTDDIWKVRAPADVGLEAFRARVAAKVGFGVSFSAVFEGHLRAVADEDAFRRWVAGRVRGGRNTLLTAHRLALQ